MLALVLLQTICCFQIIMRICFEQTLKSFRNPFGLCSACLIHCVCVFSSCLHEILECPDLVFHHLCGKIYVLLHDNNAMQHFIEEILFDAISPYFDGQMVNAVAVYRCL